MAQILDIPNISDKILFAEDLINHFMHPNARVQYLTSAETFREFIYNGFNDIDRAAVCFIDKEIKIQPDDIFPFSRDSNTANYAIYYTDFAEVMKQKCFPDGFDTDIFLLYCAILAKFAAYLYENGVLEAPSLAISYIVNAFQGFGNTCDVWDFLTITAESFLAMDDLSLNGEYSGEDTLENMIAKMKI